MNYTNKEYWNKAYSSISDSFSREILFQDLFEKYLFKCGNEDKVAIDIGCYPGSYLYYIVKKYNYCIEGIDFHVETKNLENVFLNKGIKANFYEEDFLLWTPEIKYDLVISLGFMEHFKDWEFIFNKSIELLSDNGILILEVPNFRYIQYLYHRLFDEKNLSIHNLKSMDLEKWKQIALRRDLTILESGYYGNIHFWVSDQNRGFKLFAKYLFGKISNVLAKFVSIKSKYYSPYMYIVLQNKRGNYD